MFGHGLNSVLDLGLNAHAVIGRAVKKIWTITLANSAEERRAILSAYPPVSEKNKSPWVEKVSKMSDAQVHAIYIRLKKQGKIK